jgi:MerR family transcriptional regulator/heat shock protein HspR
VTVGFETEVSIMSRRAKRRHVMISVVAERYDIHPQTLRLYEREGLLKPQRSEGNTRLYDEESIRRLEMILTLTRDMGINLAGVEVILNLREQIELLQSEVERLKQTIELDADRAGSVKRRHALVRIQAGPLRRIE